MSLALRRRIDSLTIVGDVINERWVIGNVIGAGHHDNIHSVQNRGDDVDGPIVLRVPNYFDETLLTDFLLREINFINALSDRDISDSGPVVAWEVGIHKDMPYVVMPMYLISDKREDISPTLSITAITLEIFRALDRLHGLNIVHGDVREANVLFGAEKRTPSAFLINFEDSVDFSIDSQVDDIWQLMDMMTRMYRNGEKGLLPEGEMGISQSPDITDMQREVILRNLNEAIEYRQSIQDPIPSEISTIISEMLTDRYDYISILSTFVEALKTLTTGA